MSFNRKRRFEDDGENYWQGPGAAHARNDFQPPFKRVGGRFQSRFSQLSQIEKTAINVCRDINRFGENSEIEELVNNLNHVSAPIAVEFGREDYFRNNCLTTIYTTLVEQPQKILLLSCLVQVANSKNQDVGKFVVEFFHQKCLDLITLVFQKNDEDDEIPPEAFGKDSNDTGAFNKLKLVLRFFATLSPIVSNESLIKIFEQTLDVAINLQLEFDGRCPLAECLYYSALISVPYFGVFTDRKSEEGKKFLNEATKRLFTKAEEFPIKESDSVDLVKPFYSVTSDPLPYESKLLMKTVLPAVKEASENDFAIIDNLFPDLRNLIKETIESGFQGNELTLNNLPLLSFPSTELLKKIAKLENHKGKIDNLWKTPRLLFEVFPPNSDFETMPNVASYTGLLFKDITQDLIEALEYNSKLACKQLLGLDYFFRPGLFAPINTSLNVLASVNESNKLVDDESMKRSTWAMEDIIVENILSLIFQLPHAQTLPIYYYNVLVFACQTAPAGMAPRFGKAIRFFFKNIAFLDFELRLRFLDWMALQLSNFQYKWKWQEWTAESNKLSASKYNIKKFFFKNIISKEIRLSTKEVIYKSFGNEAQEFSKYLNVAILDSAEKVQKYDDEIYGRSVSNENSIKELIIDRTIEQPALLFIEDNSLPYFQEATSLLMLIQSEGGGSEHEFWHFINELRKKVDADNLLSTESAKGKFILNLLFQTFCFASSRSISHFEIFVRKSNLRIRKLLGLPIDPENVPENIETFDFKNAYVENYQPLDDKGKLLERELIVINAILRYWNDSPQNGFIILEVMLKLQLFSINSLIQFVLNNDDQCLALTNSLGIELLFNCLSKISNDWDLFFTRYFQLLNEITGKLPENETIGLPTDEELSSNAELYDTKWEYLQAVGLIKSILTKYSSELINEKENLLKLCEEIEHEVPKSKIIEWINCLHEL